MSLSKDLSAILAKYVREIGESQNKIVQHIKDFFTYPLFSRVNLQVNHQ